ncbi:signal peptidase I [Bacillus taeanensis]
MKSEMLSWTKTILIAIVLAAIIRIFLFANYIVDGQSMLPTMHDGDRLIVNKIVYQLKEPERFDIVVFHADEQRDYIKRIIGLPGDKITYKNDQLYVNGEKLEEQYLEDLKSTVHNQLLTSNFTLEELTGEAIVPENTVFVLGDNRQNSTDSRIIGFISMEDIVGEVNLKYWPLGDLSLYN